VKHGVVTYQYENWHHEWNKALAFERLRCTYSTHLTLSSFSITGLTAPMTLTRFTRSYQVNDVGKVLKIQWSHSIPTINWVLRNKEPITYCHVGKCKLYSEKFAASKNVECHLLCSFAQCGLLSLSYLVLVLVSFTAFYHCSDLGALFTVLFARIILGCLIDMKWRHIL
jgi:hypothetical protein